MKTMMKFMGTMMRLSMPWPVWIMGLMAVNGVWPLLFLGSLEARLVLAAMMFGAVFQSAIFSRLGFVRLLGVGHVLWLALVPWLWLRVDQAATPGMRNWMMSVVVMNGISLVIDIIDVARYVNGDREPQVASD